MSLCPTLTNSTGKKPHFFNSKLFSHTSHSSLIHLLSENFTYSKNTYRKTASSQNPGAVLPNKLDTGEKLPLYHRGRRKLNFIGLVIIVL